MDFVVQFEEKSHLPVFRQLSTALRKAIEDGRLEPGKAMPSVRDLAASLSMSRSTVLKAYEELQSQGYLEALSGLGTFVRKNLAEVADIDMSPPVVNDPRPGQLPLSDFGYRLLQNQKDEAETKHLHAGWYYGCSPANFLPLAQWKQMLLRHCRIKDATQLQYLQDPFGYMNLRSAIAGFLSRSRAIKCRPEQVIVFSARENRLDLLCRVLLNEGDAVAVENPGYYGVRHTLFVNGAKVIPVPIDEEGISVEYLRNLKEKVKFVYVQPSHHEPTGVQMTLNRRKELLQWAHRAQCLIIEDDYDCEFRHGNDLLPALQGLDRSDNVIYLRCFWKVLSPLVRLGFLVVPECLVPVMALAKFKYERDVPLLEQYALADLISEGHLERHIKKARAVFAQRRRELILAATRYLGRRARLAKQTNGMYVKVNIDSSVCDERILRCAKEIGVAMVSTVPYYVTNAPRGEFILPFANIDDEVIDGKIKRLAYMLDEMESSSAVQEQSQVESLSVSVVHEQQLINSPL
jgi:GntR family transcriptional regulator/MocR family aminotransferase